MANDLRKDPIELTDAGNPIPVRTGLHIIKRVEWVDPLSYEDRASLLDAEDNIICDFICRAPHETYVTEFHPGMPFTGPFNLSELTSGKLLIYRY